MTTATTTPATTTAQAVEAPLGISQAAIFAVEYAKNAAREMLDTIREIGRNSARITKIALGVSMPHQVAYILTLAAPFMHWDSLIAVPESITLILMALGIPIATDLFILNCIKTVGTAAAAKSSKIYSLITMLAPVGVSGYVNFMAPGPDLIKWLAAWAVTLIPLTEAGRAFLKADFVKIEKMETGATEQLTRTAERLTARMNEATAATVTAGPDLKQINKQRMLAAEKARDLATQAPDLSIQSLMRAAGCGRGAAKKALETARAARTAAQPVAV